MVQARRKQTPKTIYSSYLHYFKKYTSAYMQKLLLYIQELKFASTTVLQLGIRVHCGCSKAVKLSSENRNTPLRHHPDICPHRNTCLSLSKSFRKPCLDHVLVLPGSIGSRHLGPFDQHLWYCTITLLDETSIQDGL